MKSKESTANGRMAGRLHKGSLIKIAGKEGVYRVISLFCERNCLAETEDTLFRVLREDDLLNPAPDGGKVLLVEAHKHPDGDYHLDSKW